MCMASMQGLISLLKEEIQRKKFGYGRDTMEKKTAKRLSIYRMTYP